MGTMLRGKAQLIKDFFTFPFRALVVVEEDRWGLSSHKTDRFDYVAREAAGYTLDVGCGRHAKFVNEFLGGNGKGIDVYPYEGLTAEHVVKDITHFPFSDGSFDTVTFIANFNHIEKNSRDIELAEAYRCLKPGGKVIITMANPIVEVLVHKLVTLYDRYFGTDYDVDNERGMSEGEEYYVLDSEIKERLVRAGFKEIKKKYFLTQWCLNHLLMGWKTE